MTNSHLTPHDKYFRSIMTDREVMKEFFKQNLPDNIKSAIDFSTIQLEKESFIDDKLKLQITDMLYSVEFGDESGYLYLLVEHQSVPEKLMAFRVLKYMIAIMEYHIKITNSKHLPIVYPLIFYTGNRSYKYSTHIFDLFGEDKKKLAQNILWRPYQLIDLSKTSDKKLKQFLRYGIAARIMKYIYEKDFLPTLKDVISDLKIIEMSGDMDYIYTTLSYIIEAGEVQDKQEFINTIKTGLSTINEDKVMTLAEQFRQEGRQKGIQEGIQEGYQKGRAEAYILAEQLKQEALKSMVLKLLSQSQTIEQIASLTGLTLQALEAIKNEANDVK